MAILKNLKKRDRKLEDKMIVSGKTKYKCNHDNLVT